MPALNRREVQAELHELHAPRLCLARLADVSEPLICKWLNGQRALSAPTELMVVEALNLMQALRHISPGPVDFSQIDEIIEATRRFRIQLDVANATRVQAAVAQDEAAAATV